MKKINKKPALLVILTLGAVVAADILIGTIWFGAYYAQAEIKNGEEGTANATTANNQSQVGVSNDDKGDFVTVWTDNASDGNGNGVYFRTFDRNGTAITTNDTIANVTTSGNQEYPSVAMTSNGKFIIAWSGNGPEDESGIFIRAFELDGTPITNEFRVNTLSPGAQYGAKIALDYDNGGSDGRFVVAWTGTDGNQSDVYAQTLSINFTGAKPVTPTLSGSELLINNNYTAGNQGNPSVAMNTNGDFIVVWDGQGPTSDINVWYQAYDNTGRENGANSIINSSAVTKATNPGIAAGKKTVDSLTGNFVVAYRGVSEKDPDGILARQILCKESSCNLNPVELMVNTTTESESAPGVAADYLGNFTVTWMESVSGTVKINAQRYSYYDGKPLGQLARAGTEFQVNASTPSATESPAVAMNADGQYVIAYVGTTSGNMDIKFQSYVSGLFKIGTEILTHPGNSEVTQDYADTAIAPSGYHAAVWSDSASPRSIRFSLWDNNNNVIVQNVRVDSGDTGNSDTAPAISFFKDDSGPDTGRFIIAWQGDTPPCAGSSEGTDVFYREVDAAGNVLESCETRVSDPPAGSQSQPRVAAGYYNNDGGAVEDNFAIIYRDESNSSVVGAYHYGAAFSYLQLDDSCPAPDCSAGNVALNPVNLDAVYTWEKLDDTATLGIFARQAMANTASGPSFQVNPTGESFEEFGGNAAFLANDQFLIAYSKTDTAGTFGEIWAKRYAFSPSQIPSVIDDAFNAGNGPGAQSGKQGFVRLASDTAIGDFLLAWSNLDETANDIYGQYFEYQNAGTGGLVPFGPVFRINSSLGGANFPAIDMNNTGRVSVVRDGSINQPLNTDANGVAIQRLYNPLHTPPYPALQPSAEQIITGGGRTLAVPDAILYPAGTVNTSSPTAVQTSIRGGTTGGAPTKYVEVTDLDGASFSISIAVNDDFILTPPGTTSYIPAANAEIRNWDQDVTDTDEGCSPVAPLICVKTINSSADMTSFQLDASSDDFVAMDKQQVLINKSADHEIGKWRFYPEFKLKIPARTPPGNHITTIYFSLI